MDDERIDRLIEASSLGTPAAKAFRDSVSDEEAQRIVDRANQRVIVVAFWKLRLVRAFSDLYPDLADNWINDMREEHGADALDYTREYRGVRLT